MAVPHSVTQSSPTAGPEHTHIVEAAVSRINAIAGELVLRAYEVGRYVWEDLLQCGRAPYGEHLIEEIASHPRLEMSRSSLFNCISLARAYPELGCGTIPHRLSGLSLSHLYILSRVEDPEDRRWYEAKTLKKKWSVRKLEQYCMMNEYRRPRPAEPEPPCPHDAETAADDTVVRLEPGVHTPAGLLRVLSHVGPATFRVVPTRRRARGWDRVAHDYGLGCVSVEELCLLRAFVEIASARGSTSLELGNADGCLVASADGLSLRIPCTSIESVGASAPERRYVREPRALLSAHDGRTRA